MHTIRSQARHLAWKVDGDGPNYNPFARVRSNSSDRRRAGGDPELGLQIPRHGNHSETCLTPVAESARGAEGAAAEDAFPAPKHASTLPPSASSDQPPETYVLDVEKRSKESNATDHTLVDGEAGPRQRKKKGLLKGLFTKSGQDEEDLSRSTSRTSKKPKPKISFMQMVRAVLLGSSINVLLIAVPVGIALNYAIDNGVAIFVVNFIAIIPLAAMLSFATEELALYVGETLGGLLNATFGNAVELIVSIIALIQHKVLIVQTSLIGSMLSNLLLVLGMCFLAGGYNRLEQHFNVTVAQTAASLLALSIGSLLIPTVFHQFSGAGDAGVAPISRGTSVILLVVYACYLFFQLKSHAAMYNEPSQKVPKRKRAEKGPGEKKLGLSRLGIGTGASSAGQNQQANLARPEIDNDDEDDEEDKEEPQLTIIGALVTLLISTVLVALCAEFLVSAIDSITEGGGISETFVGLILLPIVGNAAEHVTAVVCAIKDKMDLAIGVAVGSSMQIALLVLPLMVIIGWCMGEDQMTLYFDGFQIAILFVAVLLVNYLIQDGKSHWLEGTLLMATYLIISVAAWFYPAHGDVAG